MELPLHLQAAQAGLAALTGAGLGLVYDLLRAFRRRFPGLTVALDSLFCLVSGLALFALGLYGGRGLFRLFFLPALAAGALAWFWALSPLALPVFGLAVGGVGWLLSAVGRLIRLFFAPIRVFLRFSEKICKKAFSIGRKWFTMFGEVIRHKMVERGAAKHEACQILTAGEAGHSDPGGVRYCYPGVAAGPDQREKRPGRRPHR